jgi:hypothetical protein
MCTVEVAWRARGLQARRLQLLDLIDANGREASAAVAELRRLVAGPRPQPAPTQVLWPSAAQELD